MYFYKEFCTKFYRNNGVSNVYNRKKSILLNKISRNTKYHTVKGYHVTNVYENKSIMLQSFEEKPKYHVTKFNHCCRRAVKDFDIVQTLA